MKLSQLILALQAKQQATSGDDPEVAIEFGGKFFPATTMRFETRYTDYCGPLRSSTMEPTPHNQIPVIIVRTV